jgi:hypothetical protein
MKFFKKIKSLITNVYFRLFFTKKSKMFTRRINLIFATFLQTVSESTNAIFNNIVINNIDLITLKFDFNYNDIDFYLIGCTNISANYALIKTYQVMSGGNVEITDLEIKVYSDSRIEFSTPKTTIDDAISCTEIPFIHLFALCYVLQLHKYLITNGK